MDYQLENKVALIIGGSGGIGSAIAETLAAEGCHLVLNSRNKVNISKVMKLVTFKYKNIIVHAISADAYDQKNARQIIQKTLTYFDKIDILVNCSSGPQVIDKSPENISKEDLKGALNSKLLGYIDMINLVLPMMKDKKWGRIINVVGLAGKEPSHPLLMSGIVNAGLINYSKVIADEYSQYNICINCVNPGFIVTPRFNSYLEKQNPLSPQKKYKVIDNIVSSIPAKRLGKPSEIANLVAFLASEKSSYITGTTISVDGGLARSAF